MASADSFTITVKGRQTHGAVPWGGVDPIVLGSQVVLALQTIISRTVNITEAPAVVTVGRFTGGNRSNIVPDQVELEGTVRAFDENVRKDIHERIRDIATKYAEAAGGSATVAFSLGYPVTRNDPALTERMLPTLRRSAGADNVRVGPLTGHRGRLLVLPAAGAGPVLLPRRDAAGPGPHQGGAEPLAAVLRGRIGAAGGRAHAGEPGDRLSDRGKQVTTKDAKHTKAS